MKDETSNANNPIEVLEDGTEVLYDTRTDTTRWTVWRHHESKELCLALCQGDNKVTVDLKNIRTLMDKIVPRLEGANRKDA